MRRLFFILIVFFTIIVVLRRRYQAKRTQALLVEDILSSVWKDYTESKQKSADFWLNHLRKIRERYGDEIAKSVADKLQNEISSEK